MPNNELGTIRRSQVITTHGPGSIVDFRAGGGPVSVVAAGLDAWDESSLAAGIAQGLGHPQVIYEPRLQQLLHVEGFRLPPVAPETSPGRPSPRTDPLRGARFPDILQCPECKIIQPSARWGADPGNPSRYCSACTQQQGGRHKVHVVPVRYVAVCNRGHLEEFPWHYWVSHSDGCAKAWPLRLDGSGGAGLSNYFLNCPSCGSRRSMEGCFSEDVLHLHCGGRSPWLPQDPQPCGERLRTLQRGASNIYFPVVVSALSVPPWTDLLRARLADRWRDLAGLTMEDRRKYIALLGLDRKLGIPMEQLLESVNESLQDLSATDSARLRLQEYRQFTGHDQPFGEGTEFEVRPEAVPLRLSSWINRIVKVMRLREVRAFVGFTRIAPPSGLDDPAIAPIQLERRNWLPAVENRGEGIFVELAPGPLAAWEARAAVASRAAKLNQAFRDSWAQRTKGEEAPRTITPRFVLLHSLAHAIMRELSLECGYSSTSLRERIYAGDGAAAMAGVLIYTATPDSDGTLGGLARMGSAKSLEAATLRAVQSLRWCSSDPLCIEGVRSLSDPLNGAACHACLLASETSCEEFNCLLDRAFVVGTLKDPELGFFQMPMGDGSAHN